LNTGGRPEKATKARPIYSYSSEIATKGWRGAACPETFISNKGFRGWGIYFLTQYV